MMGMMAPHLEGHWGHHLPANSALRGGNGEESPLLAYWWPLPNQNSAIWLIRALSAPQHRLAAISPLC